MMKKPDLRKYLQGFNKTSAETAMAGESDGRKPKSYNITTTTAGGNLSVNAKTEYLNERMANSYAELKLFDRHAGLKRRHPKELSPKPAIPGSGGNKVAGRLPFIGDVHRNEADPIAVYKEGSDFKLFKGDKVFTDDPQKREYLQYYQRTSDIINKFEMNDFVEEEQDNKEKDKQTKIVKSRLEKEHHDKDLKEVPKTFLGCLKSVAKFPKPNELDHVTETDFKKKEGDLAEVDIKKFYKQMHSQRSLTPEIARKVSGKKSVVKSDLDFSRDLSEFTRRQMNSIKRDLNQTEFQKELRLRDFYQNIEDRQKMIETSTTAMPTREAVIYDEESHYHDHDCFEKENENSTNLPRQKTPIKKDIINVKEAKPITGILRGTSSPGPKTNQKTAKFMKGIATFVGINEPSRPPRRKSKPIADLSKETAPLTFPTTSPTDPSPIIPHSHRPSLTRQIITSSDNQSSSLTINQSKHATANVVDRYHALPTFDSLISSHDTLSTASSILQRHYEIRVMGREYNAALEISRGSVSDRSRGTSRSNSAPKRKKATGKKLDSPAKTQKNGNQPKTYEPESALKTPRGTNEHPLSKDLQQKLLYYLDIHRSLPKEGSILNPFLAKSSSELLEVKIMKMLDLLSNFIDTSVQKQHIIDLCKTISQVTTDYASISQAITRAQFTIQGIGNDKGYRRWLLERIPGWIREVEEQSQQRISRGEGMVSVGRGGSSSGKKRRVEFSPVVSRQFMESGYTDRIKMSGGEDAVSEDELSDDSNENWRPEGCFLQSGNIGVAPFFLIGESQPIQCFKEGYNMRSIASATLQFERKVALLKIIGGSKIAITFETINAIYFCELRNFQEIKSIEFPTQVTYISEIKLETITQSLPISAQTTQGQRYLQKYIAACELSGTVSILSAFKLVVVSRIDAHVRPLTACFSSCFGKCIVTADSSMLRLWQMTNLNAPTLAQSISLLTLTSAVNDSDSRIHVTSAGIDSFAVYCRQGVVVLRCVENVLDVCSLVSLMYVKVSEPILDVSATDGYVAVRQDSGICEIEVDMDAVMPIYRSKNRYNGKLVKTKYKKGKVVHVFLSNRVSKNNETEDLEELDEDEKKLTAKLGNFSILEIERDSMKNNKKEESYADRDCYSPQIVFSGEGNDYLLLTSSKKEISISYQVPPYMLSE